MKFPYLDIENFMGIGRATVDLSDKGLVLIQGVNEDDTSADSNGAGKSSLADALSWCLYGATRKGLSADEVVNNKAGKNTHVTVHAHDDDGSYFVIERWRKKAHKGKRAGCSIEYHATDGTVIDLTKGTDKLTQAEIDKAMGCPEDVFLAAIYSAQEALPDLPAMTDTELKKLIEEASGITILVRAYEIARLKVRDAEREQDTWRLNHVRTENEVHGIQSRIDDLTRRTSAFEGDRKTSLASLDSDFRQAADRAKRAKMRRDEIVEETIEKMIAECDAKIEAVGAENEQESELGIVLSEATGKHTTASTIYNQLVASAQNLRAELDKINDRVGQPCGSCGRPYCEEDIGPARTLAAEKLRIEVTKAKEQQVDVRTLNDAVETARNALETFRAGRTDIRSTVQERTRLARLLVDRANAVRDLEREVAEARRLSEAIAAKKVEPNPYGALVEKAGEELSDALVAYRKSEIDGVDLERRIQVGKDVVKVFGPAGVRAHVLDTVTPYLNARTAEYLGAMSDGNITAVWSTIQLNAKGDPVEKFAIAVNKPGDAESFAGLSGGEKRKVRLACALALQDLVASRATKPIDLWIGDEIDDALDDAGLERLMNVLETKARERGTVLVISHNSLRDWIRETATVERKGGYSTISGALDVLSAPTALAA